MSFHNDLREQLIRHEGLRLEPYRDTVGKLTIGVGRNLDDVGLSRAEAMMLLDNDIAAHTSEISRRYPWFGHLDPVRQRALIDMHFNLGGPRFGQFRKMIAALARTEGDRWAPEYEEAAAQMLDSKWARQVGRRARTLAGMVREGEE